MKYLFPICLLLLSACMSPEEIAARQQRIDQADHQECLKLGFKINTDGYGNCRLRLREMRTQEGLARSYDRAADFSMGAGFRNCY